MNINLRHTDDNINIPLTPLINKLKLPIYPNTITATPIYSKTDASMCLLFQQNSCESIFSIYGPKESRLRFKTKSETAYVDCFVKLSLDINKEKLQLISNTVKNFCESVIDLEEYPRCLITVVVNVLTFTNEDDLKISLLNGSMLALALSGIDLRMFTLSTMIELKSDSNKVNKCVVSLDANDPTQLFDLQSIERLKGKDLIDVIDQAAKNIEKDYIVFKRIMLSFQS